MALSRFICQWFKRGTEHESLTQNSVIYIIKVLAHRELVLKPNKVQETVHTDSESLQVFDPYPRCIWCVLSLCLVPSLRGPSVGNCTHQESIVGVMGRRRLGRERTAKVHQAARQRHVGRAAAPHSAAVIGDLKGTSLVVVQTAAWRSREQSRTRQNRAKLG